MTQLAETAKGARSSIYVSVFCAVKKDGNC